MQTIRRHVSWDGVEFLIEPTVDFPLDPLDAALGLPALRVLESLWFEERLHNAEGRWQLPIGELYRLDPSEASALDLPATSAAVRIQLRTVGYAGSPTFRISAELALPSGNEIPQDKRQGPLLLLDDKEYLVAANALTLLKLLDQPAPAGASEQLLYLADVKRAAAKCGAAVDRYITDQDIETPDAVGIEVEADGPDRLRIRPVPEGVEGEYTAFQAGPTRSNYTRIAGTRRQRLVLRPEHRKTADRVKQRTEVSGADVPKFFANPEAYLPESIDLSRYSLRVRGLVPKRYNSQPYVRLQPTEKRDWFALDVSVELAAETFEEGTPTYPGGDEIQAGDEFSVGGAWHTGPAQEDGGTPHISAEEYAELCRKVLATGERFVLHRDAWIEIAPESAARYLEAWDSSEVGEYGTRRLARDRARLVLDVISNLEELEFADGDEGEAVVPDLPDYDLPASLRAELIPHQQIGYRWMRYLHERELGGLLADDMGLGKTVQVISLLAHLAEAGQLQPALIVLPVSLIENWKRELAKFCPRILRVYEHTGPRRLQSADAIAAWEVVLTTYETLRVDQLTLAEIDWSVIACDEAQRIKNPTAQSTSAVKGMKARLRLAMTGTPVENGLSELWCIVDWVQPGKLGSQREFRESFERPMQLAEPNERLDLGRMLRNELTPHYIRRVKEEVLSGLPPREDNSWKVEMGPRQKRLYVDVIRKVRAEEMIPIEGLQHLIAIMSHPEIYEPSDRTIEQLIAECPKLDETLGVVAAIRARGEKAVIFTRFRRMQQILQEALHHRFAIHSAILNGEVAGRRRQEVVDRFNDAPGFGALILSPEAAGVGLNIVGANHVVHYTRLWNPAKENQATDRVHRIGQTRPVTVHYPIVGGSDVASVEERLHRLLEEKRALARDVVRPRESLSIEKEMLSMFEEVE